VRKALAFIAACLLALTAQAASTPIGSGDQPLTGVARDVTGQALEGVEVLVLARGGGRPLAVTHTGVDGRFLLTGLAPGIYRIAGLKRGYRTWLGQIDTLLTASLTMLLRTSPGPDDDPEPPESADWVLRVPRRSVLRELEAAVLPPEPPSRGSFARTFDELLDLQVEQLFLLGESLPGSSSAPLEGRETHMQLQSRLGERGRFRVDGSHERLSSDPRLSPTTGSDREASSVHVNLSYDTGPNDSLDVNAFYSAGDLDYAPPLVDASLPSARQQHRTWGYDANWSRQIDPANRVSVGMDYRDASLELPAMQIERLEGPDGATRRALSNRRIGAEGTYEGVPGSSPRHQLKVGFRAQFHELPHAGGLPVPSDPRLGGSIIGGWSLRLDAEDRWSAAAPLTLVYGLGYKHATEGGDTTLLVPRIGGVWTHDRASLKVLVSYHAADTWGRPGVAPTEAGGYEPRGSFGYDALLDVPVGPRLRLTGELAYAPIQFEELSYDGLGPATGQRPLYLTDGNSGAKRATVGLVHEGERAVTSLRLTEGGADGMLAPLPFLGGGIQLLTDSRLSYRNGSVGVRVIPSGTQVSLEYRRLSELAGSELGGTMPFYEQSVELRVMQDLLRALQGSWRLLVALRVADQEQAEVPEPLELSRAAIGHQLSAGVSVSF
jgi:hypothetical protein